MKNALKLTFFLSLLLCSCTKVEKPFLENLDLQKRSYTPTTLSSFLGNHRVITLEKDSTFNLSAFPRVIKRNGYFYIPTRNGCTILDREGVFVKRVVYPDPLENEDSWVNGYDLLILDDDTELWIASGFMEQKIYCISLNNGQLKRVIKTEYPFSDFRVVSENQIFLSLTKNHYMFGTSDNQGKVHTVGLKKKNKDLMDDELFIPYDGKYLLQYPSTTLVGYYDPKSDEIKERLLIEDNDYTNTWQKQTELIEKYGAVRGGQAAVKSYYAISHMVKSGGVELVNFTYKDKNFFAIRRGDDSFRTMEILPDKNNHLTDDISKAKDSFLQLILSFDGRTESDDSILLYVLEDRTDPMTAKARKMSIIEILK